MSGKPRLLVSVRDAAEAVDALRGGAEIVDVKEPTRGSLGRADAIVMAQVVATVAGRAAVSAALGDLDDPPMPGSIPAGLAMVKLSPGEMRDGWGQQMASRFGAFPGHEHVAVFEADRFNVDQPRELDRRWHDLLEWCVAHRAAGLLHDTADKRMGCLLDFVDHAMLGAWLAEAREAGLMTALAGSLSLTRMADAVGLGPDVVAVRGAACRQGRREGAIDPARVRELACLIAACSASPAAAAD
ncbi:MAG: hypothetical protein IT440_11805 [Phycisphaeraceae bacterium]|nr:hypothetical protein [Phycisphaeraceae bacterium]